MHNAALMPQPFTANGPEAQKQVAAVTLESDPTVQKLRLLRGAILEGIPGASSMREAMEAVRQYVSTRSTAMQNLAMA